MSAFDKAELALQKKNETKAAAMTGYKEQLQGLRDASVTEDPYGNETFNYTGYRQYLNNLYDQNQSLYYGLMASYDQLSGITESTGTEFEKESIAAIDSCMRNIDTVAESSKEFYREADSKATATVDDSLSLYRV